MLQSMSTPRRRRGMHETPTTLYRSNITACLRCRRKKKRCDQKLPRCTLCETAAVECVGYDAVAGRNVPRSYILSLEERVAYLEQKLQDYGTHSHDPQNSETLPATISPHGENQPLEPCQLETNPRNLMSRVANSNSNAQLMVEVQRVDSMSHHHAENEPFLSKILLEELMKLKASPRIIRSGMSNKTSEPEQFSFNEMNNLDTSPASLPPKDAAQKLVSAYFQFTKAGMPLLHEPTFRQKLEVVYSKPGLMESTEIHLNIDLLVPIFMVFEVFAVALMIMQKQDPSRIPIAIADRYHRTALEALSKAGIPEDLEGVQALLLIGQYSYHHPTIWAVWKTIGAALRLAVELGLHNDPSSSDLDVLTMDTMRRVFWVAYSMDRNVSIALGVPSCLSDGAITTKFPSVLDDVYITREGFTATVGDSFWGKCVNHHLLRFRQVQSEMQTVLYEKPPPPYAPIDLCQWQRDMYDRIHKWYGDVPQGDNVTANERMTLENYELTFHRALLYLYHPSTNIPTPSESALMVLAECTPQVIRLYRRFFDERRLSIYWQAVENLSSAGLALMYSYTQSSKVRQTVGLRSFEILIRTCSSVLWGMVEHFPAFRGRRDAFDIVASKTLADLAAHSTSAEQAGMVSHINDAVIADHRDGAVGIQNAFAGLQHGGHLLHENHLLPDYHSTNALLQHPTQEIFSGRSEQDLPPILTNEACTDDLNMPSSPWDLDEASFTWDGLEYTEDIVPTAWT